MKNIIHELEEIYKSKNILIDDKDVLLHENCIRKDICWNEKLIASRGGNWNRISYPYIGENYNGELMCIGLNLNGFGGKEANNELINGNSGNNIGVKQYLKKGIKKINFGNKKEDYAGTLFWYKIAVYSNIILNNCICPNDNVKLSEIYSKLVFLEAIKCSPKGNKSKPENNMYSCLDEILMQEIDIIEPKKILLLGSSVSDYFKLKKWVIGKIEFSKSKKVETFKVLINKRTIDVIKIIHPTAFGGNSNSIYNELYNLLNQKLENIV